MMYLFKLELKRVMKTRMTLILLLFALFLSFVMAYLPTTFSGSSYFDENGKLVELKGMKSIQYEKRVQSKIAGEVTTEKVRDALKAYQACLKKYKVETTIELPDGVYETEILPYDSLLPGLREVFASPKTGFAPSLMDIDAAQIEDYYSLCENRIVSLMKMEQRNYPAAQEKAVEMYHRVEKPYLFFPGYIADAMDYQIVLSFLIMLICTVIAAPIFTSDYQTKANDILRCTKYGTVKLAVVKIGVALLICGSAFTLCGIIYMVVSNCLFGWESTKTSIQLLFSIVNLPNMSIRQMQCFLIAAGLMSILATMSVVLYFSSRCKNVIVSLGMGLVFCILPLIIYIALPDWIATWICGVLPSSGAGLQTSFLYTATDFQFLNFGNFSVWLPYATLVACVIEILIFVSLTVYSYIYHKAD